MHCPPPVGSAVRLLPQLALGPPGECPSEEQSGVQCGRLACEQVADGSVTEASRRLTVEVGGKTPGDSYIGEKAKSQAEGS